MKLQMPKYTVLCQSYFSKVLYRAKLELNGMYKFTHTLILKVVLGFKSQKNALCSTQEVFIPMCVYIHCRCALCINENSFSLMRFPWVQHSNAAMRERAVGVLTAEEGNS